MEAQQPDTVAIAEVVSEDGVEPVAPEPQEHPDRPRLDESGENIFIPGLGWMPTIEFMDMYENRPQALPHDLDLLAIHEIRERLSGSG